MESSQWIATVASVWIQCSCGASYAFGIYSSVLKSSQGYDQSTLDFVSVFKDIGANFGILSGLLYAAVTANPRRGVGPWIVHAAGAVQAFAGYFFMWLAVTGVIDRPQVPLMCLFMFMAAHAQTFFNTANVVVAVQNFPEYGGTIVGIMKGFLGLSGAILIQVYQTLFKGNPSTFLLMLALLPTVISLLLMCFVKVHQSNTGDEKKHLNGFSSIALTIAAYLTILIILNNIFPLPLWARIFTCLVLLLLLFSPLKIAIEAQREESQPLPQTTSTMRTSLLEPTESAESNNFPAAVDSNEEKSIGVRQEKGSSNYQEYQISENNTLQTGDETNLLQAMCTINFWLLFAAMICGMGSGLATINNISQIGESLNYTTIEINTLVSLWSIWNFLGRFGAGYISDFILHRRGWGRPLVMALTQATMTAGHVIIASGFPGNLYVGSIIVGVCYGSQWSLMPTITSDLFGVRNMGTIFNTIAAANPVGSYFFSVKVIGYFYDKEAALGDGNSCYGTHCFMLSFFIFASVTLLGFLISLSLFFRTRRFYSLVLLRRLKHSSRQ